MTLDHALRLLAMTVDTIAALQQQIDALHAEIARLTDSQESGVPRPFSMSDVVLDSQES